MIRTRGHVQSAGGLSVHRAVFRQWFDCMILRPTPLKSKLTLRPTGGGVRWRWVCLAARGADHLTFIGLFISLRIVQDIDLVDWAII